MQDRSNISKIINILRTVRVSLLGLVIVVLIASVPVAAWFYSGRRVAAVASVSMPSDIRISAANAENIIYLDLAGINVEDTSRSDGGGYYYKDFTFTVSGSDISYYNLQLAHTTNNQFVFEVYHAVTGTSVDYDVIYISKEGPTLGQNFYYKTTGGALSGSYLNASGSIGRTDDNYYDMTYGSTYEYVNTYAVPMYWQTSPNVPAKDLTGNPNKEEFQDYYILRVKWDAQRVALGNNRETDIVYIAAKMAVR